MAKDKTRERKLPEWTKTRTVVTCRASAALVSYYGLSDGTKFVSWHDVQGAYRQGARVQRP